MDLLFTDRFQKPLFSTETGTPIYAAFHGGTRRLTLKFRFPGRTILTLKLSQAEAREIYKRMKPSGEVDFYHQPSGLYPHIHFIPSQKAPR